MKTKSNKIKEILQTAKDQRNNKPLGALQIEFNEMVMQMQKDGQITGREAYKLLQHNPSLMLCLAYQLLDNASKPEKKTSKTEKPQMVTVGDYLKGKATPALPIYIVEPYVIKNNENVVLWAGELKEVKDDILLNNGYYDDCELAPRLHDLYHVDNTKINS